MTKVTSSTKSVILKRPATPLVDYGYGSSGEDESEEEPEKQTKEEGRDAEGKKTAKDADEGPICSKKPRVEEQTEETPREEGKSEDKNMQVGSLHVTETAPSSPKISVNPNLAVEKIEEKGTLHVSEATLSNSNCAANPNQAVKNVEKQLVVEIQPASVNNTASANVVANKSALQSLGCKNLEKPNMGCQSGVVNTSASSTVASKQNDNSADSALNKVKNACNANDASSPKSLQLEAKQDSTIHSDKKDKGESASPEPNFKKADSAIPKQTAKSRRGRGTGGRGTANVGTRGEDATSRERTNDSIQEGTAVSPEDVYKAGDENCGMAFGKPQKDDFYHGDNVYTGRSGFRASLKLKADEKISFPGRKLEPSKDFNPIFARLLERPLLNEPGFRPMSKSSSSSQQSVIPNTPPQQEESEDLDDEVQILSSTFPEPKPPSPVVRPRTDPEPRQDSANCREKNGIRPSKEFNPIFDRLVERSLLDEPGFRLFSKRISSSSSSQQPTLQNTPPQESESEDSDDEVQILPSPEPVVRPRPDPDPRQDIANWRQENGISIYLGPTWRPPRTKLSDRKH